MKKNSKELVWSGILVFAMFLWGAQHPLIKELRSDFSPFVIALSRPFFAAIFLIVVSLFSEKIHKPKREDALHLLAVVLFGMIIPAFALAIGVKLSSAINSSLLINTNPVWVMVFAMVFLSEKIKPLQAVGMAISFVGVLLLFIAGHEGSILALISSEYFLGNVILLLDAVSLALGTILMKPLVNKYNALSANLFMFIISVLVLFPIGLWMGEFEFIGRATSMQWLGLVVIGFFCTGLNFYLFLKSFDHFPVSTSASYKLLIPVFASVLSVLFIGERFTVWILIAMVCTSIGIYMIQMAKSSASNLIKG